jgi:hypothetical protein
MKESCIHWWDPPFVCVGLLLVVRLAAGGWLVGLEDAGWIVGLLDMAQARGPGREEPGGVLCPVVEVASRGRSSASKP